MAGDCGGCGPDGHPDRCPSGHTLPGGLPGVETRGELIYSYGVAAGRITKEKMAQVLSANPARLYGLWPRKGVIAEGSDADLVIYDPEGEHRLHAAEMLSNADYTPYEDFRIIGGISQVWLRGSLCVDRGEVLRDRGGVYLARGLCSL